VPGVGAAKQKEEAIQVPLDSFEYIRRLLDRNRHTGKTPVVRRALSKANSGQWTGSVCEWPAVTEKVLVQTSVTRFVY